MLFDNSETLTLKLRVDALVVDFCDFRNYCSKLSGRRFHRLSPGARCYVKNLFATKLYSKESTFSGTVNAMSSFFLGLTHFEIISIGEFLKVDILLLK